MRVLLAILFLVAPFCGVASALEIYRNSKQYYLDITLLYGGEFTAQGLDRVFDIGGIKGILRLIQDQVSNCDDLVSERISNKAEDGFSLVRRNSNKDECYVKLQKSASGEVISSFYIWLKKCSCFAALHVWAAPSQQEKRNAVLQSALDQLRGKPVDVSSAPEPSADRPDVIVTSKGREGGSKSSSKCYACYLNFAWGTWNDSDGGAHMAIGVGWGSDRRESQNNAMIACNEKGYNCELTETGAESGSYNGGCGYLSLGNNAGGVQAATSATQSGALELCRSGGHNCDEPVGGCTNSFADG